MVQGWYKNDVHSQWTIVDSISCINHGLSTMDHGQFLCPQVLRHLLIFSLNMKNPIRILIVLGIEVAAFKKMPVQRFYHCAVQ